MTHPTTDADSPPDPADTFLLNLPRFVAHAKFALQHVACPDTRDDLEAEVIAIAWKRFLHLSARGKHPERFVTTLALRCSQAVRAGRRLAGPDRARDVLSPIAKARHGVVVEPLDDPEAVAVHLSDALAADTRTPVPARSRSAWTSRGGGRRSPAGPVRSWTRWRRGTGRPT